MLFYPPKKTPKSKFWKTKNLLDIIILHMCTKNHNIWCTVPEMQSETDIIFCHFGWFFALLPTPPLMIPKIKILKKKWDTKCNGHNFFVILDHFLPFYPSSNPKNQNLEKLKKNTWRYHHFTIVCHKSWSYAILFLRYGE